MFYHIYNRGNNRETIFLEDRNYLYFLTLYEKYIPVAIETFAYCLMGNHFHLLVKETRERGISAFMQKLGTAYTMYFNIKYDRSGSLLAGPFRSRHVPNDRYLQRVIQYIHCNPTELYEPGWKNGKVKNIKTLEQRLSGYQYSSLHAYQNNAAIERKLLDSSIFEVERQLPLRRMLAEAHEYYATHENGKARP